MSATSEHSVKLRLLAPILALVGLAAWEVLGRQGWISAVFFPAPSVIATTLHELLVGGELGVHIGATVSRVLSGFFFGGLTGFVLGMVMGWSSKVREVVDPFVAAAHPVPKISTLPLIMLIFGIGLFSKTLVVAIGAFFPMLINTMAGVRQISPIYFEVAENYGAKPASVFTRVVMPGSLPMVLAGARLALNRSLSITIAVELLMGENGLGSLIWYSWETLRVDQLYATILVVAVLGIGFRWGLQIVTDRLVPWQVERTV
jgi:NitT/TauT family transport system permease protein